MILFASLLGFLLPGLGHIVLGKPKKGLFFLGILSLLFLLGVSLDPDYYQKFGPGFLGASPILPDQEWPGPDGAEGLIDTVSRVLFIYVFPFCVGLGNHILGYILQPTLWGIQQALGVVQDPMTTPVPLKDVGYCFAQLAGLMNLLVMIDAYDGGSNELLYQKLYGDEANA